MQAALPPELRRAFARISACDLSTVRVRRDARLWDLGALACAQGECISLSVSAPSLTTPEGVAVLGHELAHVLQQRAGRARGADGAVLDDPALEAEADQAGLHCRAQIFPGRFADPGWPAALVPVPPSPRPAPTQLISSKASFAKFVNYAWEKLQAEEGASEKKSVAVVLQDLYDFAAKSPAKAKEALVGAALYGEMATYIENTTPLSAKLQGLQKNFSTEQIGDLVLYYDVLKKDPFRVPANAFQVMAKFNLPAGYMHVFSPLNPPWPNSRIALNVEPKSMAAAVEQCAAMLGEHQAIYSIKFLGPALGSKCDSVLAYLLKDGDYDTIRGGFFKIGKRLGLQPGVGMMWDEDETLPGFAEAMEPPPSEQKARVSFTNYRCLVVYLAFKAFVLQKREKPNIEDFGKYLCEVMALFGISCAKPHLQGEESKTLKDENKGLREMYLTYRKAWTGE